MNYHTTSVRILGTLYGPIWMPAAFCTKQVDARMHVQVDRFADTYVSGEWPGSLRDALVNLTNDGDFQYARLADPIMIVRRYNPLTNTTRERTWTVRGIGK